jgi:hypothetical protein
MAANYTITTAALNTPRWQWLCLFLPFAATSGMRDHPNLGLPRSDLKAAPALTSHFRKPKGVGL